MLPVLVHGDAAFAGQGVVAETFNLSEVPGYEVGGTVHVVVNNQLGFTTAPELGRSSVYATDVAKMVQAPIFHVNGDDPEAAVRVDAARVRVPAARSSKDVVVDLVCYRRYGHNEADEPAFTQPRDVRAHRRAPLGAASSTPQQLVHAGRHQPRRRAGRRSRLPGPARHARSRRPTPVAPPTPTETTSPARDRTTTSRRSTTAVATAVPRTCSTGSSTASRAGPRASRSTPSSSASSRPGAPSSTRDEIDWALAEALAFGSLVLEGTPVRLAGQDTRRGTFSQRHGVLVDQRTEARVRAARAPRPTTRRRSCSTTPCCRSTPRSASSTATRSSTDALVVLGGAVRRLRQRRARSIIDQFIVAAEDKWGQRSSLALLLPHGFEGQGPEHSSARIERYLTLCAERQPARRATRSTAAQYFHVLRRQAIARRARCRSSASRRSGTCACRRRARRVDDLTDGAFQLVLDDRADARPDAVDPGARCAPARSAHELMDRARRARRAGRGRAGRAALPVARGRSSSPSLDRYPDATQVWWVQEEPANMGAWNYVHSRLHRSCATGPSSPHRPRDRARAPPAAAPRCTTREQQQLLAAAFAKLPG